MRGRHAGWMVLLVIGFVALSAAPALAEEGTLRGSASLPLTFRGMTQATADHGAFVLRGDTGQVSLRLQDAVGSATAIEHRSFGFVSNDNLDAQVLWTNAVARHDIPLPKALVALQDRNSDFQLLLDNASLELGPGAGTGGLRIATSSLPVDIASRATKAFEVNLQDPGTDRFEASIPAGQLQSSLADGRIVVDGPFRLFVSGATLQHFPAVGASDDILAHARIEKRPGSLFNPLDGTWMGGGQHDEYVDEYLLVEATGHLEILFGAAQGTFSAPETTISTASATLPGFNGHVDVAGKHPAQHTIRGKDLDVAGALRMTVTPLGPGRAQLDGGGDITTVAYGNVVAKYDWTKVAAIGAGAALAMAALAWVVAQGKTLLGLGGGAAVAGYARVQGPAILEHPARSELYERIKANAGISFVQLCEAMHAGESTLTHHLRVLERNGFVTSLRDGRHLRFFDRHNGHYAAGRKVAVSALRNETTAAIAAHIVANPGVAQCDLATQFQIAASTVNWHIRRLTQVSLVEARRTHPHTRYYTGPAWSTLPAEEQAKFGIRGAPAVVTVVPAVAA